jgi:hypothetical protein
MFFLLTYSLDNYGSTLYSLVFKSMSKSNTESEESTVRHKVTSDFILDLYAEAKKKRGKNRKEAMDQLKVLSKSIGSYLVRVDPTSKDS